MDEIGDSLLMILILLNQENTIALFRKKKNSVPDTCKY